MMNTNEKIGAKMKALRVEKGLTLKQMSAESGLSIGFLSQFERGLSSIALDALETLTSLLEIPISALFEEKQGNQDGDLVVRGAQLQFFAINAQLYQATLAKPDTGNALRPQIFTLFPLLQPDQPPTPQVHVGEKFLYMLEGIITLFYEHRNFTLYPGDSIQIAAGKPHSWQNPTKTAAKILVVCLPLVQPE